jgi:FlaA1/EpsC-like NDP-sugar epimerase
MSVYRPLLHRLSQRVIDIVVLSLAYGLAWMLRFDWSPPADMTGRFLLTLPYVAAGEYLVLLAFGVPRFSWRYVGVRELLRIAMATAAASAGLLVVRLVFAGLQSDYVYLRHGVIPFGVLGANAILMFLGVGGVRMLRRVLSEHFESRRRPTRAAVPTMLVGAGQGGLLMAREILRRRDLGLTPVGFLDDDPAKRGTDLHGVRVLGSTERLAELCARHGAQQVLITMASAGGQVIRRISKLAEETGLPVQIIPGLYEIARGEVNLSRIRPVAIEDLLRREPVALDDEAIADDLRDRTVLVTGAGGSIGAEICRQVAAFRPARLLLVERAENNLFQIHRELTGRFGDTGPELVPLIADVTDEARMGAVFERFQPNAVFHAAAHKHVPMMEWNPAEAVKNNVFGTRAVAELAVAHGAESFVLISTDKAVNPTNVMGASKRMAEMVVQALAQQVAGADDDDARREAPRTRLVTVRFGNVLGSAGSVIPIFREQIARGGPVTVTHPEMRRYFMTIPEACQLVLQAGTMGDGGEIFVLDMGAPVRIVDLARDLIELSGLREGEDIEIVFTGTRPGEKLFEELSIESENAAKTKHPKIFVGRRPPRPLGEVRQALTDFREAIAAEGDAEAVSPCRETLHRWVPEYREVEQLAAPDPPHPSDETPAEVGTSLLVPRTAD